MVENETLPFAKFSSTDRFRMQIVIGRAHRAGLEALTEAYSVECRKRYSPLSPFLDDGTITLEL